MDATHCVRYTSLECRDIACSVRKVNINIVGTSHGVSVINIHLVGTLRIAFNLLLGCNCCNTF